MHLFYNSLTAVSRLRGPRLALRVRVKWLLRLLFLPLFSAAALGPFGHLAEGAEAVRSAAVTQPASRSRSRSGRITVAWSWTPLTGCDAGTTSQRWDLISQRIISGDWLINGCTRWCLHDQLQKWLSFNRGELFHSEKRCLWDPVTINRVPVLLAL